MAFIQHKFIRCPCNDRKPSSCELRIYLNSPVESVIWMDKVIRGQVLVIVGDFHTRSGDCFPWRIHVPVSLGHYWPVCITVIPLSWLCTYMYTCYSVYYVYGPVMITNIIIHNTVSVLIRFLSIYLFKVNNLKDMNGPRYIYTMHMSPITCKAGSSRWNISYISSKHTSFHDWLCTCVMNLKRNHCLFS